MQRLILVLSGYVVVGALLLLYSWHQMSEALLGRINPGRLILAFAFVPILLGVLVRLGRYLRQLEDPDIDHTGGGGRNEQ